MRIAFDHQIFGWQEYGGISRYFYEIANILSRNFDTTVGIVSPIYVNAYLADESSCLQVMGRKMPKIGRAGILYCNINQLLAPSITACFHPDVVHETYYSEKRFAPIGSKIVLTVFDMIHERFPECFSPRDSTSRRKAIAVKRADHLICISKQTRDDLIDLLGVDPAKITVVHLGFSLTKPPAKKVQQITRPYLLYVGNRDGYKNFDALLAAYAANSALQRDYDLIVFGGGILTTQERKLIDRLGIRADRIQHLGGDDTVLASLYRSAALFVYPSCFEGFGIPILEAMSFDCPVVCSNAGSIPEVASNAAELFDPRSPNDLEKAIERVLNNTSLRQTLIMAGRERIKLFSWEQCSRETLEVYRRTLA